MWTFIYKHIFPQAHIHTQNKNTIAMAQESLPSGLHDHNNSSKY